ncbi:deoxynucleotide monophosphate kinase [Aeromonas phage avDM5]|uniref:Deoxynucleotide monophosphate kinase n=1 Tax=Aeromonas phage vB_AehM_DM2 TaxID=2973716 RepID=A0AA94YS89_9CAUD|nr:deoxynucleotide monophosphate kinase [Aeromonas phage avDM5]UYD60583.1 deoxynucleotide monophosphate kinase [Aeromonas phage avDM2]UYD60825.1 deoxynucleotide monophosphate kinase [Aeromonas phage avDM2]
MIIALSAKKRCGKDTVGDILVSNGFTKYALAEPIKRFLYLSIHEDSKLPMFVQDFNMDDFNGLGYDREAGLPISNSDVFRIMRSAWMLVSDDQGFDFTYAHTGKIAEVVLGNKEAWSIRRLMQTFGTDIGCAINKRIWMKYLTDFIPTHKNIVVTDCRQDHEMEEMRSLGAHVVHILRDNQEIRVDMHSTEQGLPIQSGDHVINNDGSIDDLRQVVNNFINYIK